jgi:hypothetical protein
MIAKTAMIAYCQKVNASPTKMITKFMKKRAIPKALAKRV